MAQAPRSFDELTADLHAAVADLRSEVDELHIRLQAAAAEGREAPAAEGALEEGGEPREGSEGSFRLEAAAEGVDAAESPMGAVFGEADDNAGPLAAAEEVIPERLVSKDDAELAKTFDIACSLLGDAEERQDGQAVAYWRSLAAAALEEAARRPEFGQRPARSRISPKRIIEPRRRRVIAQLQEARERYAIREG